jgi:hypothetical protein
MKCECCDAFLTDEESRIRFTSGRFANTCRTCLDTMDIEYRLPKPAYEEDLIVDPEPEEIDPYTEDYWNER